MPYRHESKGMGYFSLLMVAQLVLLALLAMWDYANRGN